MKKGRRNAVSYIYVVLVSKKKVVSVDSAFTDPREAEQYIYENNNRTNYDYWMEEVILNIY